MKFTKMHGLGNDFMVVDAINQKILFTAEQIRLLADRHFGIGFDQLLLVEKSVHSNSDFKYRIFNADGGEVSQCGNGARCFARFVQEKKLSGKNEITVDTNNGQLVLSLVDNDMVKVNMGIPRHNPAEIPLNIENEAKIYQIKINQSIVQFGAVSMGNPHAVLTVNNIGSAPVEELGPLLERHELFPERANIGFMEILSRDHIGLRVYERGAAETLACGSGACAAVVIGIEQNKLDHTVTVDLPGGSLIINWPGRGSPVYMTGPAVSVFEGSIEL